jgi:hypothetical protein
MMRTITGIGSLEMTPQIAKEAFVGALWRFNNFVELGEFPPFRRIELDLTGELPFDPVITDTEVGVKFTESVSNEYWRVNNLFSSSDDGEVLLDLFTNAFALITGDFKQETDEAYMYRSHYRDVESALVAAEVFRNPDLEDVWGSPFPVGVYRCGSCLTDYPEFQFKIHASYRCDECGEVVEFNSIPEIGGDSYEVGRAGTMRRLVNRVVEGVYARSTGEAGSATIAQILRESPIGKKYRAVRSWFRKGGHL